MLQTKNMTQDGLINELRTDVENLRKTNNDLKNDNDYRTNRYESELKNKSFQQNELLIQKNTLEKQVDDQTTKRIKADSMLEEDKNKNE